MSGPYDITLDTQRWTHAEAHRLHGREHGRPGGPAPRGGLVAGRGQPRLLNQHQPLLRRVVDNANPDVDSYRGDGDGADVSAALAQHHHDHLHHAVVAAADGSHVIDDDNSAPEDNKATINGFDPDLALDNALVANNFGGSRGSTGSSRRGSSRDSLIGTWIADAQQRMETRNNIPSEPQNAVVLGGGPSRRRRNRLQQLLGDDKVFAALNGLDGQASSVSVSPPGSSGFDVEQSVGLGKRADALLGLQHHRHNRRQLTSDDRPALQDLEEKDAYVRMARKPPAQRLTLESLSQVPDTHKSYLEECLWGEPSMPPALIGQVGRLRRFGIQGIGADRLTGVGSRDLVAVGAWVNDPDVALNYK